MSLLKEAFNFVLSSAQEYSMKIYEEADSLSNYSDEELLDEMNNGYGKKKWLLCLKDRLETYKIPVLYGEVEVIQRTFNGKIDRKFYAV